MINVPKKVRERNSRFPKKTTLLDHNRFPDSYYIRVLQRNRTNKRCMWGVWGTEEIDKAQTERERF